MYSILMSIKKLLGIDDAYTHFDQDIIMHINTAFATLNQLGVGPDVAFSISDKTKEWSDFGEVSDIVKSYIYLRVRMLFDPPANSTIVKAINDNISELEWRLYSSSNFNDSE